MKKGENTAFQWNLKKNSKKFGKQTNQCRWVRS